MNRRALQRAAKWGGGGVLILGVLYGGALRLVPLPAALLRAPVQSIALLDRTGRPLRETRNEERFSREIALEEVPAHFIDAILAAEDKRFFAHAGIDAVAIARSLWGTLWQGRPLTGASTISQQLVKISRASPRPRTFQTKCLESLLALRLEQAWNKADILSAYLNRLDFGNLNVGLAAAADYYFRKPVGDLSVAEAAFLAGLPINPRRLNPHTAFERARHRQQIVLRRMHDNGRLSAEQYQGALDEALKLATPRRLFRAPHFVDLVLSQSPGVPAGGRLRTTLDLGLNDEIQRMVRERMAALRDKNAHNAAAVVIENATGNVLALVGSEDYFAPGTGQVNGAWAPRSAGSTLKPFTYLLALEKGATPATLVADVRTAFATPGTGPYRPENYNRRCYGPVRYRTALASSLNIPAVKVLQAAGGPEPLHERLRQCGFSTLDRPAEIYGLGLTLGNCETRLLELTNAYAALARMGQFQSWHVLASSAPVVQRRITSPELAWQIADMLSDNAARTLAFGAQSALRFDYPVACKTGTSSDFRDNWALGFTPEFTVGVWVGNFDGAPMHEVSGVTGAAPLLHAIFDRLHTAPGTSWYAVPPGVEERDIQPLTGKVLRSPGNAPDRVRECFLPTQHPEVESAEDYDAEGRVRLGPEYADWMASAENSLRDRLAPQSETTPLRILSPAAGSVYVIDPDIPSSSRIPLRVAGGELSGAAAAYIWTSDSLPCEQGGQAFAQAREGRHRITVSDPKSGRRAETWVKVRAL